MKMTPQQRQELINDLLFQIDLGECDYPVVSDTGALPTKYKGIAVEINERGNVTVWKCFKNGGLRELASRV